MKIQADLRPIFVHEKGLFKPEGRHRIHGADEVVSAYFERTDEQLLTARFLVGFNVHGEPRWTEDDLVRFVVEIREKQSRSANFLIQRGIWRPYGGERLDEPDEDGAQILIINEVALDKRTFANEMIALGEDLVRRLNQDVIFLVVQEAGLVVKSFGITP